MPRRAILSTLLVLTGALSGLASPLNPAARNTTFQPRSSLGTKVLRPAQARILGGEQRLTSFPVQQIAPVLQAPVAIKLSREAFSQPAGSVVRPAAIKAAGGG